MPEWWVTVLRADGSRETSEGVYRLAGSCPLIEGLIEEVAAQRNGRRLVAAQATTWTKVDDFRRQMGLPLPPQPRITLVPARSQIQKVNDAFDAYEKAHRKQYPQPKDD